MSPSPVTGQRRALMGALLMLWPVVHACGWGQGCSSSGERAAIVMASTTSTDDTGLFGVLVPAFERDHPEHRLSVVAVGSGQALALGRSKDADLLLVHSKEAEEAFVAEGHGLRRRELMYNDFVIVGPPPDPAGLGESGDSLDALRRLAESGARFVSRADGSGTHVKEREILDAAGLEAGGDWHLSIGQGMGEALRIASEMQAYTLSDRGTFLAMRRRLELDVIVEGDERLLNPYGVIEVRGARNEEGARLLADWLVSSDEAREMIRRFGADEHGQPLFFPIGD